ncbi:MAG: hypothetical protein STSR0004_21260 [Peptococcaceae bacterium]
MQLLGPLLGGVIIEIGNAEAEATVPLGGLYLVRLPPGKKNNNYLGRHIGAEEQRHK